MNSFGEQLKFWRILRGYSQMQLAYELGMSPRNLSFIETGRSRPKKVTIYRLVKCLNISSLGHEQLLYSAGLKVSLEKIQTGNELLKPFHYALTMILSKNNPYPAIGLNQYLDLVGDNAAARKIFTDIKFGDNLIEKCLSDSPWMRAVLNKDEVRWNLYREMHRDFLNVCDKRFMQLFASLERYVENLDEFSLNKKPIFCLSYQADNNILNFISIEARFLPTNNISEEEMRIRLFLPGDANTDSYLQGLQYNKFNSV